MSSALAAPAAPPKYRPLAFGVTRATLHETMDGTQYLMAEQPLQAFGDRMSDRLLHWARATPDTTFIAQRVRGADGKSGDWRHVSYAQALDAARRIGQALIDRGLSAERPVVVLSDNGIDHALMALGCLFAGVPYSPASPAYSTISKDYGKLRHVIGTLTPGLIYAEDGDRFGAAIAATAPADAEVVLSRNAGHAHLKGRAAKPFADLLATEPTPAVDAAQAATGPETIVKFLFTSGSTKLPKAVINTNRMWCANQQQMRQSMPVLTEEPPVLIDWLPWNHTFGGNHNFGLVLSNGGTLYVDEGKPTPALIGETLRNLREIAPTLYFNVPTGFEAIANAMKTDDALRKNFLSRVKMFFYAGAALAPAIGCALRMLGRNPLGIELLQDEFAPRNTFDVIRTALATVLTLGFLAVAVMTWSAKQELTAERVKFGDRHAIAKHVFKGAEGMYLQQVDAQTEVAAKQNVDRWLARGEGDPTAIRRIQRQLNRRLDYLKDQMGLSERIPPLPSALEVMTAIYKAFESVPRDELGYLRIERMTIRPRQVQMSILAETTTTFDRVRELLANAPLIVERARNPRSPVEQGSLIREGEYMKQDYTIDFREDD